MAVVLTVVGCWTQVDEHYWYQMSVDDLPVWGLVGKVMKPNDDPEYLKLVSEQVAVMSGSQETMLTWATVVAAVSGRHARALHAQEVLDLVQRTQHHPRQPDVLGRPDVDRVQQVRGMKYWLESPACTLLTCALLRDCGQARGVHLRD
jgi:hypothetical protein